MADESDALGLIGTTVAEKYAIECVVGAGGFATVYRANHILWKRPVAVKVFTALGEVAPDQRQKLLDDFIQEGALLADLSERSTAIVQARDVGTLTTPKGEKVPYMVLEWLEGRPLDAVLADERAENAPLRSLDQTVRLLDLIAEALSLAHKKGIAHRDVKPANVFVLGDPRGPEVSAKLLDFGIAKVVQDAQKMGFGKTAGHITSFTPLYGAPEQFNRAYGATGPWTDVFALALVAAEVVSGREPMVGDNLVQLAYASSDPATRPTPRTLGVETSDDVEQVFQKAVAVKPEDRYQTVGEFWQALRTTVLGDPLSSRSSVRRAIDQTTLATSDTVVGGPGVEATTLDPPKVATAMTAPLPDAPNATTAPSPVSSASPSPAPKKSAAPIAVGGVLAVALVGTAAFFGLRSKTDERPPAPMVSASAPVVVSATASASASASAVANDKCPKGMIAIPGGEFFMGSDEADAVPMEKPPHKVMLAPYCLDELEVSVDLFKVCSDKGACRRAFKQNDWPGIKPAQRKIYDPLCNANDPAKGNHPVNCVDWEQARELCGFRGGRLPTEAEWEFAARGPDGRIYPWGDAPPSAKLLNACGTECVAWAKANPDPDGLPMAMYDADDGFANTAPVGSFPNGKSRYGIQDVVGNVWEWVADWHAPYDPGSAKAMATDPKGPEKGKERVIRGGAWNGYMASWVRPSFRFSAAPTTRSYGIGFRCAKSL